MSQNTTLEIQLGMDGDKWHAMYGPNIQEGCNGFGDSPVEALRALCDDLEFYRGKFL